MKSAILQRVVAALYPPECVLCRAPSGSDFGLCPGCLVETPFLTGPICDRCGIPVLSDTAEDLVCDDCTALARPWGRARAVFRYEGRARQLVLGLKHGDRLDLARAAAPWLAQAAAPLIGPDTVLVPVPLHPRRQFQRRYNQAAELTRGLARQTGLRHEPTALRRTAATPSLDHRTRDDRMAILKGVIEAAPQMLRGAAVLLVDDVMTTGATLSACADAALSQGAARVDCVVLARVEKDDVALRRAAARKYLSK